MTSRITSKPAVAVRTPSTETPAKPKATTAAQSTKAAGWSAGVASGPLKVSKGVIDDGPKISDKVAVPKGYKAQVDTLADKQTAKIHGKTATLDQELQNLSVTGPGGKKVAIGGDAKKVIDGLKSDWSESVKDAQKAPPDEFMMLNWSSSSTVAGAGTAGKLFSVMSSASDFTGGAHPNSGSTINTYDASTGKQVKLDQLLTEKQMTALVNDIAKQLPGMSTPDGILGQSFAGLDKASLRETINENFAVSTDKNGKVKVDLAWESGIHALGPAMAHFSVDVSNDAGFRSKAGIE
jgi:hypothetical protein